MSVSPARAAAYDILFRVERESSYASELLHSSRYAAMSPADHSLATELVMGVLRWRSLLDATIASASSQALAKLDLEVLIALRIGAYQLGWLDRIPAHAAIHESVELVKRARKRSAMPFANAVLRKLAETRASESTRDDRIREATTIGDLAAKSAHPSWIVERWAKQFDLEVARSVCGYDQRIPATSIRLRDRAADFPSTQQQYPMHVRTPFCTLEHIHFACGVCVAFRRVGRKAERRSGSIRTTR